MFVYSIVCSKGKLENKWVVFGVTSLVVQWLVGTLPFYCRGMGSILIGATGSYMPCGVVKKILMKKKKRGHWLNNLKSIHAFGLFCNN